MRITDLPSTLHVETVALWRLTSLTRPWNDPDADLRRAMEGASSTVLAALDDECGLLGTAMVCHDGHRGWVYYMAVQPRDQRKGIGRKLMEACEHWVRQQGVPKLNLLVRQDNTRVMAFYHALGYVDDQVSVLGRRIEP